jgi:hypothetical protein
MRSKLLISTAALLAGMAMASAQTTPQGGAGQPGPSAAPERSAPQPSPRGGQAQQGQDKDKGKAQQGAQGQGQDKDKAQQGAQGQGQDKGKAQQGAQGQDRTPAQRGQREGQRERETTGQGAQGQRDQAQPQRGQRDQSQQGQRGQDSQPPRAAEGQAGQGGSATLTAEQRTRVRETVITRGPRVTSVDFSISVGAVVPRTVTLVVVPAVLVEFYPQYRGRKYFVYNDEIIIVDDEYRIVAVIQV